VVTQKPCVALLASPKTTPSVLFGLYDVLLSAGAVYPDMTFGEPGDSLLDVMIVSASAEPFRCFGNVLVEPHAAISALERVEVAVVCDMYTPIDTPPRGQYLPEIAWLKNMHAAGALIASVCSGSLVLAEAGLLDGMSCATHWGYVDLFRRHYPSVRLRPDSILNLENESRGIVTAGGVTSWQELALHIITRLCGRNEALRAAKVYLLAGHEDGQLPFAAMSRCIQKSDAAIADCQAWMANNFATVNPVGAMTAHSKFKSRTFARRFKTATGLLPMEYVHALRIEEAKRLLETTGSGIDDVGFKVGYQDPTFFRRLFKRMVGITPAAYRRKFLNSPATA
jgi:transcriptional regulator GlxA family with amidase domain